LEHGVRLPGRGKNYVSYSYIAGSIGRTYAHSTVRDIIIDAYVSLEKKMPEKVFKYGETGFKEGGRFKPHKTHQNGLSVDFIVPVLDGNGRSVHLPTNVFNKFGYSIEFDRAGTYGHYRIDFEALAAHIYALQKSARRHGVKIKRVIFDPALQPLLFRARDGSYLKENVKFSKTKSWVRHDEHYHIDFDIPCQPL
jgi:penicillin-insensitive murein endopeptidase